MYIHICVCVSMPVQLNVNNLKMRETKKKKKTFLDTQEFLKLSKMFFGLTVENLIGLSLRRASLTSLPIKYFHIAILS